MSSYVMCINNAGVKSRLKLRVVYKVCQELGNFVEVVDETGSPTLFMARRFAPVELPEETKEAIA